MIKISLRSFGPTYAKKGTITMVSNIVFRLHFANLRLESLPFDLQCGLVGYFGYEMKYESLATSSNLQQTSTLPDAYLLFADRIVAIDHQLNDIYVVALSFSAENEAWLHSTLAQIQQLDDSATSASVSGASKSSLTVSLRADYGTYTCKSTT